MSFVTITYTVSNPAHFNGTVPILHVLRDEVEASADIEATCVNVTMSGNETVNLMFNVAALTAAEQTALDAVIVAHSPPVFVNRGDTLPEWLYERRAAGGFDAPDPVPSTWTTLPLTDSPREIQFGVRRSGNALTIDPGTYKITVKSTFYRTSGTRLRLYNVTDSTVELTSFSYYIPDHAGAPSVIVDLDGYFVVSGTSKKVYEMQYWAETAPKSGGGGLGKASGANQELYTSLALMAL